MPKPSNTQSATLALFDARIERVASRYSDAVASVRATLVFECEGASAERRALAATHRIAADFLDLLSGPYTAPQVELRGSHRNRTTLTLTAELCSGSTAEAETIEAALHDAVPAPH